jgi:hypothetical protein
MQMCFWVLLRSAMSNVSPGDVLLGAAMAGMCLFITSQTRLFCGLILLCPPASAVLVTFSIHVCCAEELLQRATNDAVAEQRLIQRMRGLLAPFVLRRLKSELAEQMVTKSHKMHEVRGGGSVLGCRLSRSMPGCRCGGSMHVPVVYLEVDVCGEVRELAGDMSTCVRQGQLLGSLGGAAASAGVPLPVIWLAAQPCPSVHAYHPSYVVAGLLAIGLSTQAVTFSSPASRHLQQTDDVVVVICTVLLCFCFFTHRWL